MLRDESMTKTISSTSSQIGRGFVVLGVVLKGVVGRVAAVVVVVVVAVVVNVLVVRLTRGSRKK